MADATKNDPSKEQNKENNEQKEFQGTTLPPG